MMKKIGFYLLSLLSVTSISNACPVCFGAPEDPITEAAGMAIMFLFVIVCVMLTAVISFFYTLRKRAQQHQALVDAVGYDPEENIK
ncbi:MAG: hypothetical protein AAFY98_10125 [Verrucomicrobiota bacterium]